MAKKQKAEPAFHYYASTVFNWRVGDSKVEILASLARSAGSLFKANKDKNGGLEAIVMRVELPQAANYTIRDYAPEFIVRDGKRTEERVPITEHERVLITTLKGDSKPRLDD